MRLINTTKVIQHVVLSFHCRVSDSITSLGRLDWSLLYRLQINFSGTRPRIHLCITGETVTGCPFSPKSVLDALAANEVLMDLIKRGLVILKLERPLALWEESWCLVVNWCWFVSSREFWTLRPTIACLPNGSTMWWTSGLPWWLLIWFVVGNVSVKSSETAIKKITRACHLWSSVPSTHEKFQNPVPIHYVGKIETSINVKIWIDQLISVYQLFWQVTSFKNPPSVDYQNNDHWILWCVWLHIDLHW